MSATRELEHSPSLALQLPTVQLSNLHPNSSNVPLKSPTPSFADSFSTAFTSPFSPDDEIPDGPSRIGSATLAPAQSLRKSISVDSFVKYGRDTSISAARTHVYRGSPSYMVENPSGGSSSGLKRDRYSPPHTIPRRDSAINEECDNLQLPDSDVERNDPLNSPLEQHKRTSLKSPESPRSIRGGELLLPSRRQTLSTSSTATASTSTSTLEDTSTIPLTTSSLRSLMPRPMAGSSSSNTGRTRSESLGMYAPSSRKRTAVGSHMSPLSAVDITLAVVGTVGCGKSGVIRKGLTGYRLSEPTSIFASRSAGHFFPDYKQRSTWFNEGGVSFPLHIVEVNMQSSSNLSTPYDLAWPEDRPPIDAILICYDSSDRTSFQPVEGLLETCRALKLPIVVLACKVDLQRQVEPEKALEVLQSYDVGLIEVTNAHDSGKGKMRQSFDFLLKAVLRERKKTGGDKMRVSDSEYKNPASPDIISKPAPWDGSRNSTATSTIPTTTTAIIPTQSGVDTPRKPQIPLSGPITNYLSPPLNPPVVSDNDATNVSSTIAPVSSELEPEKSSGDAADKPLNFNQASKDDRESSPVESKKGEKEEEPLAGAQWASVDELLDKLMFLAVSGDDPAFLNHFLLTYRRFTNPRSVLLAMQKRMRLLDNPCGDPMFACFAQMRICHLLHKWLDTYPHDFAVKGTQGALNALVKSIISKTHLLHYGSELLPFLEIVPILTDHDATWASKSAVSADESDDSYSMLEEDEEDGHSPGKDSTHNKDALKDLPTIGTNNAATMLPSRERKASLPLPKSLFTSGHRLNAMEREDADPSPKQLIKDLLKLAQEVNVTDPEEIAQEITGLEVKLFMSIKPRDWLYYTFTSSKKDESEPVTAFNILSNHLANWVVSLILCHDKPKARARQMEKFVEIAHRLRMHNNYSALRAFVAGINNSTFPGDETMEYFKTKYPDHAKCLQSWDVLLQQTRAHRAYRTALRHSKGACIPAMEVHMSDLIKTQEGNEDFYPTDPSKVHWAKFSLMGRSITTTSQCQAQCQNSNYNFPERKVIRELIARPVMNVELQKSRISSDGMDSFDYHAPAPVNNQPKDLVGLRKIFLW